MLAVQVPGSSSDAPDTPITPVALSAASTRHASRDTSPAPLVLGSSAPVDIPLGHRNVSSIPPARPPYPAANAPSLTRRIPAAQPRWAIVHQGAPPRSIQLPRRVDSFEPPQHVPEDDESQEEAEDGMVAEDGMLADDEGASTSDDVESDGGLFPMDEAEDAAGTPPPSGGRRRAVAWPWRKEWRP